MTGVLAADAATASGWQQWLPVIIAAFITACGGVIGTVWVQRMKRRLDDATARAQDATAEKSRAESKKASAETISMEVATARTLIEEIEKMMARQRVNYEAQIVELGAKSAKDLQEAMHRHDMDLRDVTQRLTTVEGREQQLRSALVSHAPWDRQVWERVRTELDPDWPPPPPLEFD